MASDRFVYWTRVDSRPTKDQVQSVLEDYLGEVATEIRWGQDRFFITLVGKHSHPFKRILTPAPYEPEPEFNGRHIEVWVAKDCLDVLTRQQDEFTSGVADGLAAAFVRFWEGELDA